MRKFNYLVFMSLVLALAGLSWGVGQAGGQSANSNGNGPQNQLKDLQNAVAATHAQQGLQRSTTNDQRWQAAIRNADRRAEELRRGKDHGNQGAN